MIEDRLLTPPKVAQILGTGADQVLAWIRLGELKASNLSLSDRPRWKIAPADLQRFLDDRSNKKRAKPVKAKRRADKPQRTFI